MRKYLLLPSALIVSLVFLSTDTLAHPGPLGEPIGEYRLTLDRVEITSVGFGDGFLQDGPDIFIRTDTQAATHELQTAMVSDPGDFPLGWDNVPVPVVIPVGKLIYRHFDCQPAELISLTIVVADKEPKHSKGVNRLLATLGGVGGILAIGDPVAGPAAGIITEAILKKILRELEKMKRPTQGNTPGNTIQLVLNTPSIFDNELVVAGDFQYTVDLSGEYVGHIELGECTKEKIDALNQPPDTDRDGITDAAETAYDSDPSNPNNTPEDAGIPVTCADGIDNDLDGLVDGADPGCPEDVDGDSIPNLLDECPEDPEDFDGFQDADGCSDPDNDNDSVIDPGIIGVDDAHDNCPNTFNPDQADADGDGIGDACESVADVKLTQVVAGPAALQVSEDGAVTVTKTLHNNGPFGPVDVDISANATAPVGCTATPDPLNATSASLPVSTPVDVIHLYTIHCTDQSEHTFTFDNDITVTTLDVVDPDTTNNSASDTLTVIVNAKADVKLTQTVAGPAALQVSEDGAVTVTKTLHNNGPFGPVIVLVPPSATAPVGCTATFVSGAGGANLPVSVPVVVVHLYTIHCTDQSEHIFSFNNNATINALHVVDPDTTNNSASSTLTVIVTANADIKITSFTCNQTGTTTITCDKVLHNNGTITVDVNVDLSAISSAPAQCDVTPASKSTTVTLPPTTPVTVTEIFDLVGTGSATITIGIDVTPSDPHVIDADGATASDSVAADCAVAEPHDAKLLKLVGPSKVKGGTQRQYIAQIKVNSPADEIPVAILVVDPISGCGTPTIDVEDPFDITPGEPDSLAIDIDDDGVLEAVAISRALNTDEQPISAGDQVEAGTAHWKVSFPTCGPDVGTPFDYIVTADACHSGDPDPKGFFTDAFGADCPVTQAADGGIDPNQANDAPVARLINDKLR